MKKVCFIIPYFGEFPPWMPLFLSSCSANPEFDFTIISNVELKGTPGNVTLIACTFEEFCGCVSDRLGIDFRPNSPYKLCDVRPFYGYIFKDLLDDCDFWGFCDIDLIFGDLKIILDKYNLENYKMISSQGDRIAGPLSVFANIAENRMLPFGITRWEEKLKSPKFYAMDEKYLSRKFSYSLSVARFIDAHLMRNLLPLKLSSEIKKKSLAPLLCLLARTKKAYFHEYGCTPEIGSSAMSFTYHEGKIFDNSEDRELPYLHFLFFKKNLYRKEYLWGDNASLSSDTLDFDRDIVIDVNGINNTEK